VTDCGNPRICGDGYDGALWMMRFDNDHHGAQRPLASAVHALTVIATEINFASHAHRLDAARRL